MSRRRLVVFGTVVCVTAGLVAWVFASRREPRYQGKSLSEWLQVYEKAADNLRREAAADAIRHMRTKAIPFLMRDLRYGVPDQEMKLSAVMGRLPRPIQKWWRGWMVKHNTASEAALGLAILGPLAEPVIPELVAGLDDTKPGHGEGRALTAIGGRCVPYLSVALTNQTGSINHRGAVLAQIQVLGRDACGALEALIQCSKSEPKLLEPIMRAIGSTATNGGLAMSVLTNAVQAQSVQLRLTAIESIGMLREEGRYGIAALMVALQDPDAAVRKEATNTLTKIAYYLGADAEAYGLLVFKPPKSYRY